jgi:hypothetical protein
MSSMSAQEDGSGSPGEISETNKANVPYCLQIFSAETAVLGSQDED